MRPIELSMRDLFPHCIDVLSSSMVPLHYKTITEKALARMDVPTQRIAMEKEIENVREKLLKAGQHGTFYLGAPHCLGAMRWWFATGITGQMPLIHADEILISGNATAGADGAFECLMRSDHMTQHTMNTIATYRARANGLVLEKHVVHWFMTNWPDLYLPPDNEGQWTRACNHDFKIRIAEKIIKADVAGPDRHGNFGRKHLKNPADIHLLCRINGPDCYFVGAVRGAKYTGSVFPDIETSPVQFVVWLNCHKAGVDYQAVRSAAVGRECAA